MRRQAQDTGPALTTTRAGEVEGQGVRDRSLRPLVGSLASKAQACGMGGACGAARCGPAHPRGHAPKSTQTPTHAHLHIHTHQAGLPSERRGHGTLTCRGLGDPGGCGPPRLLVCLLLRLAILSRPPWGKAAVRAVWV